MKKSTIFGLTSLVVLASVSLGTITPHLKTFTIGEAAIAQTKGAMQLNLSAEKQIVEQDQQGKKKTYWQPLQGNVMVKPGEVMRYTIMGENTSDRSIKNLVLTQPIPKQMVYVLNTVGMNKNSNADVTYSIDNGKNFVAKPTIPVKIANGKIENRPAPASAYTHIRWKFVSAIAPKNKVAGNYIVKVR